MISIDKEMEKIKTQEKAQSKVTTSAWSKQIICPTQDDSKQEPPKKVARHLAPENVPLRTEDDDHEMQEPQHVQQHVHGPPQPTAAEQENSKQILEMKNQIAALSELVQSLLAKLNTM